MYKHRFRHLRSLTKSDETKTYAQELEDELRDKDSSLENAKSKIARTENEVAEAKNSVQFTQMNSAFTSKLILEHLFGAPGSRPQVRLPNLSNHTIYTETNFLPTTSLYSRSSRAVTLPKQQRLSNASTANAQLSLLSGRLLKRSRLGLLWRSR